MTNEGEIIFGEWLRSQGCHALYPDQEAGFTAGLAKKAKVRRPIHRPDFLALMDGFGTMAFDVKHYTFQVRQTEWLSRDLTRQEEHAPVMFVRMVWEEILELYEFQRVSNLPTWLCLIDKDQQTTPKKGWFFRIDLIHETYSRLFIARELGFIPDDAEAVHLFSDWPALVVERRPDDQYPSSHSAFDFVLDTTDNLFEASSTQDLMKFLIPAIVLELGPEATVADLIDLQHIQSSFDHANDTPPSYKQIALVENIVRTLNKQAPERTKLAYSNFISLYLGDYRACHN